MITLLLLLINTIVSYRAYQAFNDNRNKDDYLLIPSLLSRGENWKGAILSQFSHVEFFHFLFNMMTLYYFGPVVENFGGSISLLIVYILSGIGSIFLTYIQRKNDISYSGLGASGCISGVLFTSIVLYPQMKLYMFLIPIPIQGPIFAFLYLAYSLLLMNENTGIGHEAHLGGALIGFLFGGYLANGYQNFVNEFYKIF